MVFNFSVITWNVENLFPPKPDATQDVKDTYQAKLTYLADKISAIDPTIVALQEVGDPAALADLQSHLPTEYKHLALGQPDKRQIRVGLVSKIAFDAVNQLTDFPAGSLTKIDPTPGAVIHAMGRGALHVKVKFERNTIHVLTTHLKSKLITYPNGRFSPLDEDERARETAIALIKRTGEASALRVYLNSILKGNNDMAILMGDLNDEPHALTTQMLLGPFDGSIKHKDKGDDVRLYSLAGDLPPGRNFSRIYKKSYELIDHIMVSHDLMFVPRQVDAYTADIDPIDENRPHQQGEFVPDHAPLYARFEIPKGRFVGG